NVTAAEFAHEGQHGLHHRDRAEYIHIELPPHFREWRFLHDALVAVAGIVDQHIDGSDASLDFRHDAVDRIEVGHVEHTPPGGMRGYRLEFKLCLRTSHCADDLVTRRQRFLCERAAKAAADA